jgi:hypothetical protein
VSDSTTDSRRALAAAVAWLEQGLWEQAHGVAQDDGSALGSWLHGIVHLAEGDLSNARYWYRQAGRPFPKTPSVEGELTTLKAALGMPAPMRGSEIGDARD